MQEIKQIHLKQITGGDRWGDGQDQRNNPPPKPPGVLFESCTPIQNTHNVFEECIIIRVR